MRAIDNKKKFLIAIANEKLQLEFSKIIQKHISNCQFYFAKDGQEALHKVTNDPPHIIIAERDLQKVEGIELVRSVFDNKKISDLAVILISEIPDKEHFVDEVVLGKVQFLNEIKDEDAIVKSVARALNYISRDNNAEFFMKFLATGETLLKEGDKADYVYIVIKGKLDAYTEKTGQKVILGSIQEGEFVGEMAYINGQARTATVVAKADCELIEIPVDHLDHLLFQKPAWSKALFKTLSHRVQIANKLKEAVTQSR